MELLCWRADWQGFGSRGANDVATGGHGSTDEMRKAMIGSRWRKIFHFALDSAALWMVASVAIGMVASLLPAHAASGLTVRDALAYDG